MEEFKRLLRAFTVYNGEKVEQDLKITKNVKKKKADLIFVYVDYIAERSAMLLNDERLMEDDLVKELDNSLKALSVFYLNPAPIDFGQFFNLLWDAFLDMESLFTELDSPSSTLYASNPVFLIHLFLFIYVVAIVKISNHTLRSIHSCNYFDTYCFRS